MCAGLKAGDLTSTIDIEDELVAAGAAGGAVVAVSIRLFRVDRSADISVQRDLISGSLIRLLA